MPELPHKRYVRRGDIIAYFGIDGRDMTKLVDAGVFRPLWLRISKEDLAAMAPEKRQKYERENGKKKRAFFRRDEVIAAEHTGRVFKTERAT